MNVVSKSTVTLLQLICYICKKMGSSCFLNNCNKHGQSPLHILVMRISSQDTMCHEKVYQKITQTILGGLIIYMLVTNDS